MIAHLTDEGAKQLCHAILAQAVIDYRMVIRYGGSATVNLKELDRFFRSSMFNSMLGDSITPEQFKARAKRLPRNMHVNRRTEVDL